MPVTSSVVTVAVAVAAEIVRIEIAVVLVIVRCRIERSSPGAVVGMVSG
jgi:hypothetical protein